MIPAEGLAVTESPSGSGEVQNVGPPPLEWSFTGKKKNPKVTKVLFKTQSNVL